MKIYTLIHPQRTDAEIRSPRTPGVFWSSTHNSYVLARPLRGAVKDGWLTPDGQRVQLVSINGIGEVRWYIRPRPWAQQADDQEAIDHFRLEASVQ